MSEVEALQTALTGEHAAVYGYGVIGARSSGSQRRRATTYRAAHRAQRDALRGAIVERGGVPVVAEPAYALPGVNQTAKQLATLGAGIEDRLAGPYASLVGEATGSLREWAISSLADCAVRSAQWSGRIDALPGLTTS